MIKFIDLILTFLNILNIMETNLTKNFLALILLILPTTNSLSQLSKKFEPIDVFDIEYVSDPQIHSDGDKHMILYQRNLKVLKIMLRLNKS